MKHILSLILFISVFNLQASQPSFLLGVDVFMQGYVDRFCAGKTVGLMTNQSGLNAEGKTTIDLLYQHPSAKLVKLFAPEHGIRGKIEAGIHFKDSKDSITGLPIVSLYGVHGYRPKVDSLRGLDMVIYDIQDVGSRAYTYIWSLREMMTVCGQLGIDVIVLDRPDPYGAAVLDGPICDTSINSLLTRSAIPRVYGMTVGEIARYFNKEDRLGCNLIVIPMAGYKRGMLFENTGIKWKETSPNIPDLGAARCFPMTGTLGLLGQLHIGIGTKKPFQLIAAPWVDANKAALDLEKYGLPGVRFGVTSFTPPKGLYKGQKVNAVTLHATTPSAVKAATVELALLYYFTANYKRNFKWEKKREVQFDRAMGTNQVRKMILGGKSFREVVSYWQQQRQSFAQKRQSYLIYK